MDLYILVGALGPVNYDDADGEKHWNMGYLCTERRICCHHA